MNLLTSISALALLLELSDAAACNHTVACLTNHDPVCGSDGQTYSNQCVFDNELCLTAMAKMSKLTQLFKGACDMDPNPFCAVKCSKTEKPVCGTDGKSYANKCLLKAAKCKDVTLRVAHKGKCKPVCHDVCPTYFNPMCGSDGVTYNNPCLLEAAACKTRSSSISKRSAGLCEPPESCFTICPKTFAPDNHAEPQGAVREQGGVLGDFLCRVQRLQSPRRDGQSVLRGKLRSKALLGRRGVLVHASAVLHNAVSTGSDLHQPA